MRCNHQKHQPPSVNTHQEIPLQHSSKKKLNDVDLDYFPATALVLRQDMNKAKPISDDVMDNIPVSKECKQNESKDMRARSHAYYNMCNNSNRGANENSRWDEMRKAICPEETKLTPSAAYIEQDVISKQRKEIMLLMEELGTRDQELNDLVRSHQSQVKAWEADRTRLKELQQRLHNYEKELQRSDHQLKITLDQMKEVSNQKDIDGMELKKTKGEMELLLKQIQDNSYYLKELEIQNKSLMDSVKKLLADKEDLELKGKDLTTRLKSKSGELNMQASEIARMNTQISGLESQVYESKETIKNLKTETSVWRNRYCIAKDETDGLTAENKKKEDKIQNLTSQLHETLQQTLALQKALYTSCEREKCKEEIMNSLRKQQKRTMQEMTSLRKLYERQSKDMTLYHLSVQGANSMEGQDVRNEVKTENAVERQGRKGQGEGRFVTPSRNNRNMSYNKPNFLKYKNRGDSSFLIKKKIYPTDSQSSQDSDSQDERACDERKDDSSDSHDGEVVDKAAVEHKSRRPGTSRNKEVVESDKNHGNAALSHRDDDDDDRKGDQKLETESEHKRRSLSTSNIDNIILNKVSQSKPTARPRSTSPVRIQERGTSPIANLALNDSSNKTQICDIKVTHLLKDRSGSHKGDINEAKKETIHHHSKPGGGGGGPLKQGHNETSGVFLSSSECSSSALSSPGRDRMYDELTPADSDGMCHELKREYLPPQHEAMCSFRNNKMSIHLGNLPARIPEPQSASSSMVTKPGNENTMSTKHRGGQSYRLAEDDKEQDRWTERMDTPVSCLGMSIRSDETKDNDSHHLTFYNERGYKEKPCRWTCSKVYAREGASDKKIKHQTSKSVDNECKVLMNKNENKILPGSCNTESNSLACGLVSSPCTRFRTDIGSTSSYQCAASQRNIKEDKKLFSCERKEREDSETSNRNISKSSFYMRRAGSCDRCVRIVSPERDIVKQRKKTCCDVPGKGEYGLNISTDSFFNCEDVAQHSDPSSLHESIDNNISLSCPRFKGTNSCIETANSLDQRKDATGRNVELNEKDDRGNRGSRNRHELRDYFYEEKSSSSSEISLLKKTGSSQNGGEDSNAYIVPVSTSSRPFTSTRAPSLYKQLSSIHFSEKSKRYEWTHPNPDLDPGSQECHQGDSALPPVPSINNQPAHDTHLYSKERFSEFSNSNGNCNNNSDRSVMEMDNVLLSGLSVDESLIGEHATMNMDKFHHHYNNIVKKLNCSSISYANESHSLPACQDNNVPPPVLRDKSKSKTVKDIETNLDETLFNVSQKRVTERDVNDISIIIDNDVVRKLDFSDSTFVDKSNVETTQNSNILDDKSRDSIMNKHDDRDLHRNCFPQSCQKTSEDVEFSIGENDQVTSIRCTDGMKCPNNAHEVNVIFCETQNMNSYEECEDTQSGSHLTKSMIEIDDYQDDKLSKDKEKEGNGSEFAASLPDYFPDMSSIADNSCHDWQEEEEEDKPIGDLHNDVTLERCGNVTPPLSLTTHLCHLYSHTSTPTIKSKIVSTNDLNASYNCRSTQETKEKVEDNENLSQGKSSFKDYKDNEADTVCTNTNTKQSLNNIGREMNTEDISVTEILVRNNRRNIIYENTLQFCDRKEEMKKDIDLVCNDISQLSSKLYGNGTEMDRFCEKVPKSNDKLKLNAASSSEDDGVDLESFHPDLKPLVHYGDNVISTKGNHVEQLQNQFDDKLSSFLTDSSMDVSVRTTSVPMSPASKLHHLLIESQEMLRKLSPLKS